MWIAVSRRLRAGLACCLRPAESGQGLTEYALILVGIFLVVFAATTLFGHHVVGMYTHFASCFQNPAVC